MLSVFYSDDFTGHWPVGTAAIVVARDETEAIELMDRKLREVGLVFDGTMRKLDTETPTVLILRDGEY